MSSSYTLALDAGSLSIAGGAAPVDDEAIRPERIGGKAASLARMARLGLRVPPAFVIETRACRDYFEAGGLPEGLREEVRQRVAELERHTGCTFGGGERPLLVSVRSGAAVSMPGMMDTVLNLGIDETTAAALARLGGDPAFAHATHRRFLEMFAKIVFRATMAPLSEEGTPESWRSEVEKAAGRAVPEDPYECLDLAVGAVFSSFHTRRARRYREHAGIPHDIGTACTVQAMVFGNLDDRSGTGVLFSRNPLDGSPAPYGEYLPRAQGEDVVSGTRDPLRLDALEARLPEVHAKLLRAAALLEREAGDVQDIEFTVQHGELFFLQTRNAKRSPAAATRLAKAFVDEGLITPEQALTRVTSEQVRRLLRPRLADGAADRAELLLQGEAAGPGVGRGLVVNGSDEAERRHRDGDAVVLMRATTSPEDVHGMLVAEAIVTEAGGSTSHAAVVSRGLGRPCVVGCGAGTEALKGREVTVDGDRGRVYAGLLEVVEPDEDADPDLTALMEWARLRCPVTITTLDDGQVVDSIGDDLVEAEESQLVAALRGRSAVKGAIFETHAGVEAALRAGVRTLAVRHRLPALLSALEALSAGRANQEA